MLMCGYVQVRPEASEALQLELQVAVSHWASVWGL